MSKDIIQEAFEAAPEELKQAGLEHHKNVKRLRKAEDQVKLWTDELSAARSAYKVSETNYTSTISRYNPETRTMYPDLKEMHPETNTRN